MSDSNSNAIDPSCVGDQRVGYERIDTAPVALDLIDGTIINPISTTAFGIPKIANSFFQAYTGTTFNGIGTINHSNTWTTTVTTCDAMPGVTKVV